MKKSPLELIHYFITDFSISANKEYDPEKEAQLELSDLSCAIAVQKIKGEESTWQGSLRVQQKTPPEKNSPYDFYIRLIGYFKLDSKFPRDTAEQFVLTNGTAMLYGAAREALRVGMANGPYLPLLLPSITFPLPQPSARGRSRERST